MPAIIKSIPKVPPVNNGNRGIAFPLHDTCIGVFPELGQFYLIDELSLFEEIPIYQDTLGLVEKEIRTREGEGDSYKPCHAPETYQLYTLVLQSDISMSLGQQEDGSDILVIS